jgi:hypothetical protein
MLTQGFSHADWLKENGCDDQYPCVPYLMPDESGKMQPTRRHIAHNGATYSPADDGVTGMIVYTSPQSIQEQRFWMTAYWQSRQHQARENVRQAQKLLYANALDSGYCDRVFLDLKKIRQRVSFDEREVGRTATARAA